MKIHKEGTASIIIALLIVLLINVAVYIWCENCLILRFLSAFFALLFPIFILSFFRKPNINPLIDPKAVVAPADGKVVVIEKTRENEYFKDERIQVSIFMSVWNVHINWYPISGIIKYFKYHKGKYLLARNPKSSLENERTTVVIEDEAGHVVLYRQIAGIIARRIVAYAKEQSKAAQSKEAGFIKFGSRVDVLLPLDAELKVKIGDKVKGAQSIIAKFAD